VDGSRGEQSMSIGGVAMICIISITSIEVKAVVHNTHKWMSSCHVAVTEYGFNNPDAKCFCVGMDKENE